MPTSRIKRKLAACIPGPNMHWQIAILQRSVLWHNGAKGECRNMFLPLVNRIKYHPSSSVRGLPPAAIVAVLLLAVPVARTQNAARQGEKSEAVPAGTAESGT